MNLDNQLSNSNLMDLCGYSNATGVFNGGTANPSSWRPSGGVAARPPSNVGAPLIGANVSTPESITQAHATQTPVAPSSVPPVEPVQRMEPGGGMMGGGGGGAAPASDDAQKSGGADDVSFYQAHKTAIWVGGTLLLVVGVWYAKKKGFLKFGKS